MTGRIIASGHEWQVRALIVAAEAHAKEHEPEKGPSPPAVHYARGAADAFRLLLGDVEDVTTLPPTFRFFYERYLDSI